MPDDIRACCKRPKIESNKLCLGSGSSDEIYRHWFPVYYELTTLPINSEAVRHSPDVIARLRALGWDTSPQTFDAYWHRVNWISSQCQGRVLEIGCGMGNVTRWIAANPAVESIVALDVQGTYIATLKSFPWPKVTALCIDVSLEGQKIASYGPFETVVLAELIEHISLKQELTIVDAVRPYILGGARWVISTPIGFMSDPDHKRGFGVHPGRQTEIGGVRLDTSTSLRLQSWKEVLSVDWPKHPVFGYGVTGHRFFDAQYPRVLVETGLVGLLTFLWLQISLFRRARDVFRSTQDPLFKGVALGFLTGFIALIVHSIGTNTFIIVRIMEPFWFLAGMVMMIPALETSATTGKAVKEPSPTERGSAGGRQGL